MADKKPLKIHATSLCPQQFESGDTVPVDNGGTGLNEAALTGLAGEYLKVNATEDGYETGTPGGGGGGLPYTEYVAFMYQSGTSDPAPVVASNTIGAIVWTRNAVGSYQGYLAGAFPTDKTFVYIDPRIDLNNGSFNGMYRQDDDTIIMYSIDGYSNVDGMLQSIPVEIRVYP